MVMVAGVSMLMPERGVRIVVHDPYLLPPLEEEGVNVGAGTTSINIKRVSQSHENQSLNPLIPGVLSGGRM